MSFTFFRFALTVGLSFFWLCGSVYAAVYPLQGNVIGSVLSYEIQGDDDLYGVARQFDLGIVEVLAANPGVDPWQPKVGTKLALPMMHVLPDVPHRGIVINLSELRLYYFSDEQTVVTFPIGIGREGRETPVGKTKVIGKREHPVWIPPASIRAENPDLPESFPAGPNNPLGDFALDLGMDDYRIHGTNLPYGVGKRVSHGCLRLYPEDIAELFSLVAVGTPVTIIDTNYKLGWQGNTLWLQVTPTQQQADEIAAYKDPPAIDIPGIYQAAVRSTGPQTSISWYALDEAIAKRNGIAVMIAERAAD